MAPQGARHRVNHQVGVGEIPIARELGAQFGGRGDVGLGGQRELGRPMQALHHAVGDSFADASQRDCRRSRAGG